MYKITCKCAWFLVVIVFGTSAEITTANAQQADSAAVELIDRLSLRESDQPIREHSRWARPKKVAIDYRGTPEVSEAEYLADIEAIAGAAEVILFKRREDDPKLIVDADVYIGGCSPRLVGQLKNLRWMHSYSVGVERCLNDPGVRKLDFIMSNNQRISAPTISETAVAMILMLAKNLHYYQQQQYQQHWSREIPAPTTDLSGQTLLILGLGGIGTETARRASALGMRVIATRNSSREGPDFVDKVGLSDEMYELAAEADFVVNALPSTEMTNGLIDRKFFDALKPGAHYVNVGRGRTTVTDDMLAALNDGTLAGAGLDVTDPEPLPSNHPLWLAKNVIITPHVSSDSGDATQRMLIVAKENLRRYVRGDKMLSLVDVERGY